MEIEKDKIQAVYKYLREEFPECEINNEYEPDLMTQKFRVECKESHYILKFHKSSWDDNRSSELYELLKRHDAAKLMLNKITTM